MKDNHTPELWGMGTRENTCVCEQGGDGWVIHRPRNHPVRQFSNPQLKHIVDCVSSYQKHCGDRAIKCAEGDLLGECLNFIVKLTAGHYHEDGQCIRNPEKSIASCQVVEMATAILSKTKGGR